MRFFLDLGLNGARRARDVRRWRNRVVSVSDCVNYNGFGYRRDAFHPLHRYLFDCEARGLVAARRAFVEFLRFYRPCDAAQALGLAPLDKEYPLFLMPWYRFTPASFRPLLTWRALPLDCSDLLTRYSARGLASYLIEQEWFWAERALDTLRNHGYDTRRGILQARAFVKADGERRYLLTDGNHRAAAMTFLGWDEVEICCDTLLEVRECDADKWWGVRHGFYSRAAALALFHAYINGNARPHVAAQPAPIEASPDWKKLYLPEPAPRDQRSLRQRSLRQRNSSRGPF